MERILRHRDGRAPSLPAIARYAHIGLSLGRSESGAAVGNDRVSVAEVDRLQISHRPGAGHGWIDPAHHVDGGSGSVPGAPPVPGAKRHRLAAEPLPAQI